MGPLPASLKNWWRMVWQEKVTCILMATGLTEKGAKKCERYWAPRPGVCIAMCGVNERHISGAGFTARGSGGTFVSCSHVSCSKRSRWRICLSAR
jgi:protein tyrosine phosphatase